VFAFIFDHEREVRGRCFRVRLRTEEYGEGVGPHGLNEYGAIGNLVEFGRVHGTPSAVSQKLVAEVRDGNAGPSAPLKSASLRMTASVGVSEWKHLLNEL
jgi:hypothetical protein